MSDHFDPLKVAQIVDRFRKQHLGDEPDWKPLEGAIPAEWCGGFMWMTRITQGATVIELYKHGLTRRYLNLDHDGGAWRFDHQENVYRPQPLDSAVEAVFEDIELCGADRVHCLRHRLPHWPQPQAAGSWLGGDHVSHPAETRAVSSGNLDRSLVSRPGFSWPLMNTVLWIRKLSCV